MFFSIMPRNYARKKPKIDENIFQRAIEEVQEGSKVLVVAEKYGIPRETLRDRVNKAHNAYFGHHHQVKCQIFTILVN